MRPWKQPAEFTKQTCAGREKVGVAARCREEEEDEYRPCECRLGGVSHGWLVPAEDDGGRVLDPVHGSVESPG